MYNCSYAEVQFPHVNNIQWHASVYVCAGKLCLEYGVATII